MPKLIENVAALLHLSLLILAIPLSFDLGGLNCGLSFSLTLAVYSIIYSLSRIYIIYKKESCSFFYKLLKKFSLTIGILQPLIVPGLLIFFLDIYSETDGFLNNASNLNNFDNNNNNNYYLFDIENYLLKLCSKLVYVWGCLLEYGTAPFTLTEGFCSLIVIQITGRLAVKLVNNTSEGNQDYWMIAIVISSASIISIAIYTIYHVACFPIVYEYSANATSLAVIFTCTIGLATYGMISGRGNPIESSLLIGYISYCAYEAFTDFSYSNFYSKFSSNFSSPFSYWSVINGVNTPLITPFPSSSSSSSSLLLLSSSSSSSSSLSSSSSSSSSSSISSSYLSSYPFINSQNPADLLPPYIIEAYSKFISAFKAVFPDSFKTFVGFVSDAYRSTIPPSIAISLIYRIAVLYFVLLRIASLVNNNNINYNNNILKNRNSQNRNETNEKFKGNSISKSKSKSKSIFSERSKIILLGKAAAPTAAIILYTNLVMHHLGLLRATTIYGFGIELNTWVLWNFANMIAVLFLYFSELWSGGSEHWKED